MTRPRSRRGIERNVLLIATAALLLIAAVALPLMLGGEPEVNEATRVLAQLQRAELEYESAFGDFVEAEAAPRAPHEVDATPVPWKPNRGYRKLSWAPEGDEPLFCAYAVVLDGDSFVAQATCDEDGDGAPARFEVRGSGAVVRLTPDGAR